MKTKDKNKVDEKLIRSIGQLTSAIIVLIFFLVGTVFYFLNQDSIEIWLASVNPTPRKIERPVQQREAKTERLVAEKVQHLFKAITASSDSSNPALIQLGKMLYLDKNLSKKGNTSCNSCHNLNFFGADQVPRSTKDNGQIGTRNTPSILYTSTRESYFWDGRAANLAQAIEIHLFSQGELGIPSQRYLIHKIKNQPEYQLQFKSAFPEQNQALTFENMKLALVTFLEKLTPQSRFDQWLLGNEEALTARELEGLSVFIEVGCSSCHNGIELGGNQFQKFGVYGDYWEYTKSEKVDRGLLEVSQLASDKYVFRVPSLRNAWETAPYFHDGTVENLDEAIRIMGKLQLNKILEDDQVQAIEIFLGSLTAAPDSILKSIQ